MPLSESNWIQGLYPIGFSIPNEEDDTTDIQDINIK